MIVNFKYITPLLLLEVEPCTIEQVVVYTLNNYPLSFSGDIQKE